MTKSAIASLLLLTATTFAVHAADAPAPVVWEITHEKVMALDPDQSSAFRDKDKQLLHNFPNKDLRAFENVYARISVTTGFTGAHLLIKEDRSLNAFAAHTNTGVPIVVFTSGMYETIHGDPDAIAAVMGHEFGHQVLHHRGYAGTTEAINLATQLLDAVIAKGKGNEAVKKAETVAGGLVVTGVLRSFDRDQEREADEFGIKNMIRAGFNPEGAVRLWQMPQMQGGGWLSTHPSSSERLDNVRKFAVQYASLAPAAPPPGPDTSKPTNPFAERIAKLGADIRAHCAREDLQPYYKKTACVSKDISFDQFADTSKATDEEKEAIQKVRSEMAEFNKRMASALREYGATKGASIAALLDKFDQQEEDLMLNLYTQKITWGDYNKRRKDMQREYDAQANAIKAAK